MLKSGSTLSLVSLDGNYAHIFWVGDSPIFYSTKKDDVYVTEQISVPDVFDEKLIKMFGCNRDDLNLNYKQVRMDPEDIISIISDGCLFHPVDFNSYYDGDFFANDLAKRIISDALGRQTKNNPYNDDVSYVALRKS